MWATKIPKMKNKSRFQYENMVMMKNAVWLPHFLMGEMKVRVVVKVTRCFALKQHSLYTHHTSTSVCVSFREGQ